MSWHSSNVAQNGQRRLDTAFSFRCERAYFSLRPAIFTALGTATILKDEMVFENETRAAAGVTEHGYWIACLVFNSFIIICQLFIVGRFILLLYRKTKTKSRCTDRNILTAAIFAVGIPISRYGCSLAVMMVELDRENDVGCEVAIDFSKSTFVISMFFVNGFFWVRQRAFYRHPSLGMTFGRCAGILSKASACLLVLIVVTLIPLSVFPWEYEAGQLGCMFRNGEKIYGFRNYIYASSMLMCQLTLLGLFLYPLWMHRKSQLGREHQSKSVTLSKSSDCNTSSNIERASSINDETTNRSVSFATTQDPAKLESRSNTKASSVHCKKIKQQTRVLMLIKRTLILASTAVATDLIVMIIVGAVLPGNTPQVITRVVYDADMFINGATVVLSFENWKEIIFPFMCFSKD